MKNLVKMLYLLLVKSNNDKKSIVVRFFSGRIYSKRSSGTKLYFYDLHSDSVKVQIMANLKYKILL
jgi:lysyl-tRNA synthetase class 2